MAPTLSTPLDETPPRPRYPSSPAARSRYVGRLQLATPWRPHEGPRHRRPQEPRPPSTRSQAYYSIAGPRTSKREIVPSARRPEGRACSSGARSQAGLLSGKVHPRESEARKTPARSTFDFPHRPIRKRGPGRSSTSLRPHRRSPQTPPSAHGRPSPGTLAKPFVHLRHHRAPSVSTSFSRNLAAGNLTLTEDEIKQTRRSKRPSHPSNPGWMVPLPESRPPGKNVPPASKLAAASIRLSHANVRVPHPSQLHRKGWGRTRLILSRWAAPFLGVACASSKRRKRSELPLPFNRRPHPSFSSFKKQLIQLHIDCRFHAPQAVATPPQSHPRAHPSAPRLRIDDPHRPQPPIAQ